MAENRAAKLQKLNHFRRKLPHVSVRALGAIATAIAEEGAPDGLQNRNALRAARDSICKKTGPYGPILDHASLSGKEGEMISIALANSFAMLYAALDKSANMRALFQDRLAVHPCSLERPWSIILYSDGVTPGNVLAVANNRKLECIYWSFAELGFAALSHEECWFVLVVELHSTVRKIAAGMSQVFGSMLHKFFDADGLNMSTTGVLLQGCNDLKFRLFAACKFILQDGAAHKAVWHSRGDGGSRYCMLCTNLFTETCNLVEEDGTNQLVCNIIRKSELKKATGASLRRCARVLARKATTMNTDDFAAAQQALGMTHHAGSILLDRTLDQIVDPVKHYLHDLMHCLFVDGVCNVSVYLLLEEHISAGEKGIYGELEKFLRLWAYPGRAHGHTHL